MADGGQQARQKRAAAGAGKDPAAVEVFYEESKAARAALDAVRSQFRSNTTTILALATGATAFFGFEDSGKGVLFTLALVSYAVAAVLAALVFRPHRWMMNQAGEYADRLSGARALDATALRYELALEHQEAFKINSASIKAMRECYVGVMVATAFVVLFAAANVMDEEPVVPAAPMKIDIVDGKE